MGSLWDLCGISGGIVGECCDLAMVLSWSCCVISRGILMVLLGDYSDTAMVLLWKCFGINYGYNVVVLMWIPVGLM